MPKLALQMRPPSSAADVATEVSELSLSGFIDAQNYAKFERGLEDAYATGGRFLVLDFSGVHYINSTGISALIRFFELYREREGLLCLASVAKSVGLSMHLLGVTSLIPFLKDLETAHAHIQNFIAAPEGTAPVVPSPPESAEAQTGAEADPPARRFVPLRQRRIPGLQRARVVVITPSKSRFTRVLRLRFKTLNGDYHLFHDTTSALAKYREISPDLVVVDQRCDPRGDFVNRVKIEEEKSLTSIIKLYTNSSEVERGLDFKIWENDYLVEPFEVLQLFSLTEAELARLPKDRRVLLQQIRFEFKTRPENVERAYKLSDLIVRQAIVVDEDATAMYAAVKEGIDNAVTHGNRSDSELSVDVNFLVDRNKLTVIIEDRGEGFDYEYYLSQINTDEAFEKIKRRIVEERVRGGLGILLMCKCTDRIEYSGTGNVLRLEKNI